MSKRRAIFVTSLINFKLNHCLLSNKVLQALILQQQIESSLQTSIDLEALTKILNIKISSTKSEGEIVSPTELIQIGYLIRFTEQFKASRSENQTQSNKTSSQ